MTARFELGAQLQVVVDLPVEHDPHGFLGVGHRLVAAGEVDDREPPESEPEIAVEYGSPHRPVRDGRSNVAMRRSTLAITGSRRAKLNCPAMPHILAGRWMMVDG